MKKLLVFGLLSLFALTAVTVGTTLADTSSEVVQLACGGCGNDVGDG